MDSLASIAACGAAEVRFADVRKSYGANRVLRGLNFTLDGGGMYCLMAPSGSGKTTLFRVLLGLEPYDAGSITGVSAGDISMMFQEDRLCEALSAIENVALVLPGRARRSDVRELLSQILPATCLDQPVMELSGGMRRRVSLARAVAYPGKLLVLDEPFTGLDAQTRRQVIDFLLASRHGRTLLVATHGEQDAELLGARRLNLAELQGE